jgi:Leucine-rich repeat (LRR) protein
MTRDEVLAVIAKAKRKNATELDLSRQGLTELPPEIGLLTALTTLDLQNNQLRNYSPQ